MQVFANIGIPMITVQMPLMLCALIPVIVMEALLTRRWLRLPYRQALRGVARANFVSTVLGVPVAWLAMLVLELVTAPTLPEVATVLGWEMQSPVLDLLGFFSTVAWLPPFNAGWSFIIPAAAAVLLIPSFYISVWAESQLCLNSWPDKDPALVRRSVYFANVASYASLFLLTCAWMAFEIRKTAA